MNFTLSFSALMPLAPVMIVALTLIAVMLLIAVKRNHNLVATATVVGLNLAALNLILMWFGPAVPEQQVMGLFAVDRFTLFYQFMILVAALACCTLSHAYIESYKDNREELYLMMLASTAGAMLMVASNHYASFFISLELMSIPLYGLLAYTHQRGKSLEAGLKYLVLSATASAMLLMGMAYIYAYTGTLSFVDPQALQGILSGFYDKVPTPALVLGLGLMICAVAFKLSMAPFHKWTPDVYAGAPAPIATFLGTVAKVAMIGLFIRFVMSSGLILLPNVLLILIIIATLSIIVGNLLAVRQVNLKRILAYSSIAHFGYILVGLVSINYTDMFRGVAQGISTVDTQAVTVYVLTYVLTTIGAFGVVTLMSSPYNNRDEAESLADYRGMFWRRPILTAVLTLMMLSLAGIPLTAGFIAKFMVIKQAVMMGSWFLSAMVIVGSGIGLYYYLRVIVVMYMTPPEQPRIEAVRHWGQQAGGLMVLGATALVFVLGVYPEPMLQLAKLATFSIDPQLIQLGFMLFVQQ
ncbi:NADH-quinone oxidoreductase subunit NuoN [Acinetobacter larvae]|uniref:NADH-quinone oxidoreductase subunit N n=1 Tax=Acinetobacter larvae TaxID=1789224 RepID=A0A1B2LX78_9GAMM|nr:NADH-quinone oxidoreductase subunit NuoN [Acinetobacter larvae]AOA57383.1 NADH-quinone oxidoreductase subunit N [Acinetobacter larvae]